MTDIKEILQKIHEKAMNFKNVEGVDATTPAGKAILKVREKFRGVLGDSGFLLINLVHLINILLLHDKFAAEGIYITNENREEKYIEILEKDDPKLLEALEKYIEALDRVDVINNLVKEYDDLVEKIKSYDGEDFDSIIKEYIER